VTTSRIGPTSRFRRADGGCSQEGVAGHSGRDGELLYHIPGRLNFYANDAGDVDGDGLHDLLVPPDGGPGVFVFSGADGDQIHHLLGKPDGGLPVLAVGIGDIDADGHADIAVGDPTPGACHGEVGPQLCTEEPECDRWDDPGMVTVYSGAEGEILHTLTGSEPGEGFGGALVVVGDVDLDGTAELAVSARPGEPCDGEWVDSVYVYSMRDWSLVRRIDEVAGFGSSLGPFATGDIDGDGHADLGFWEREGRQPASLVVLSVVDGRTLTEWRPGPQGEPWGLGVGDLWDLDADGAPDFLLGDWESRAAYWYYLSDEAPIEIVSGATGRPVLVFGGDDNVRALRMGRAIGNDMDGDGRPDLLVSTPYTREVLAYEGEALLFWGSVWAYALRECPRGKPSR